jgi:hypothetical protein
MPPDSASIPDPTGWEFYCDDCETFREARRAEERDARDGSEYYEFICTVCHAILTFQRPTGEVRPAPDVATEMCPHCGDVNLFPGFTEMQAYTCRKCGKFVRLSDDPNLERFFGPEEGRWMTTARRGQSRSASRGRTSLGLQSNRCLRTRCPKPS